MTAAAVFTHYNQTWTQPVTLVRKSGSESGWLELPHEELTPLEIAGYRHRWDRMVWEADRRKVDFFWPRAAAFVQQRWAELHPDDPALQEVRFAKVLQRAANPAVRNPQGHWVLRPVAELPRKDVVELARCMKSPAAQVERLPFRSKKGFGAVLKQRQAAGEAAALQGNAASGAPALQEPGRWVRVENWKGEPAGLEEAKPKPPGPLDRPLLRRKKAATAPKAVNPLAPGKAG